MNEPQIYPAIDFNWSFFGVRTTKSQADIWRASLNARRCPWCNAKLNVNYGNHKKHLAACPKRPE